MKTINHHHAVAKTGNVKRNTASIVAAILALASTQTIAAAPPPDSGSLLQQNQQIKPSMPAPNGTGLVIPSSNQSALPDTAPFMVNAIEIVGNTVFDTATLHALVADAEGKELTLQKLADVANRITEYYHSHGYPLARAYIPAQTINSGLVRFEVIEARYGQIRFNNKSLAGDGVIAKTLSTLQKDQQIEQTQLNRSLLLLSDIPGVSATSTLKPGTEVGTSDLDINVDATSSYNGNISVDNYGNTYTGKTRLNGLINFIDPLQMGDVLSVNLSSTGRDMNNGALTYETLADGSGTRVGASFSALHYTLGESLSALGGHGIAQVSSLWMKYPWQRTIDVSVYTQAQFDHKKLNDDIDSTGIRTNRHTDSITFSINGDAHDDLWAGSQTTLAVSVKAGELNFDNASAQALDETSANTHGGFLKWNVNYARLQNFTADTAAYIALATQWANGNLDSSEKMVAGGLYTVRGYDMGVLSGDTGALGTLELRQQLGELGGGSWQAVAFADSEHVTINQTPWTKGLNGGNLTGAGLGLNWANAQGWHAKVYVAAPVGSVPVLAGKEKSTHTWAEIGMSF